MFLFKDKFSKLLVFLFFIVFLLGCDYGNSVRSDVPEEKQDIPAENVSHSADDSNRNIIERFSLEEYSESGEKKWQVEATEAEIYKDIVKLTDVVGVAYGEQIDTTIKSDSGAYNKTTRDFQLLDNVNVTTTSGIIMLTDKLNWKADEEQAFTKNEILVKNETMNILGQGAWAKPDLKEVQFEKNVVTNIKPDTIIMCDGPLRVNYKDNYAIFNNNVVVKDDKGRIWADKMTVYFNKKREIEKVVAQGNVKIKRGKNITLSERAEYIAKENKVVLTGKPKLFVYPESDSKQVQQNEQIKE